MTARPTLLRPTIGVAVVQQGVGVDEIDDAAFERQETETLVAAAEPKRVGVDRDTVPGAKFGETDFPIGGDRDHAVAGSIAGGVAADGVATASG